MTYRYLLEDLSALEYGEAEVVARIDTIAHRLPIPPVSMSSPSVRSPSGVASPSAAPSFAVVAPHTGPTTLPPFPPDARAPATRTASAGAARSSADASVR